MFYLSPGDPRCQCLQRTVRWDAWTDGGVAELKLNRGLAVSSGGRVELAWDPDGVQDSVERGEPGALVMVVFVMFVRRAASREILLRVLFE